MQKRKRKKCTARDLLEVLGKFRERFDPEDVRNLDLGMREGEQPADWSSRNTENWRGHRPS